MNVQSLIGCKIGGPEERTLLLLPVVHAFGIVKKAFALVDQEYGLEPELAVTSRSARAAATNARSASASASAGTASRSNLLRHH